MVYLLWIWLAAWLTVLVHEMGHVITAVVTGMRVQRFEVGLDTWLALRFRIGGVRVVLGLIPMSGATKIAGMPKWLSPDPDLKAMATAFEERSENKVAVEISLSPLAQRYLQEEGEQPHHFTRRSVGAQRWVVLGGVLANAIAGLITVGLMASGIVGASAFWLVFGGFNLVDAVWMAVPRKDHDGAHYRQLGREHASAVARSIP